MKAMRITALIFLFSLSILMSGCSEELKDCRVQNATQRKEIERLRSEMQAAQLEKDQLDRKLASALGLSGAEVDALRQKVEALEADVEAKKALIMSMQQQLLYGGAQLPVELSTMLEEFAKGEDMVTYDAERGIVKFKSDLLFQKGSDQVASAAVEAVNKLCSILNNEQSSQFDIIIAGHTDDIPISKPATRAKHPTNWHLSAHRAISVLNIMLSSKIAPDRVSIRGFGEYRPVAENKEGKKGNAMNRRVEIYLVPHGM
jgi:chemotaxis protein MotB